VADLRAFIKEIIADHKRDLDTSDPRDFIGSGHNMAIHFTGQLSLKPTFGNIDLKTLLKVGLERAETDDTLLFSIECFNIAVVATAR
jgi:hypothetical protein